MAKRFSAQRALPLIWEEREAFDDDVEEEVSECEHHISDSDFEEEDEIEHQLVPKRRRAPGPARQRKARMWYSCVHCTGLENLWLGASKPEIIRDYDVTEGVVDNMDRLVTDYSCKRRTQHCHWWYSLTYWKSLRITPFSSGWHWSQSGTEGSSRGDASSQGTEKDTGGTSNPEKTTCSKSRLPYPQCIWATQHHHWRQFIRLHAASSGATKVFIYF